MIYQFPDIINIIDITKFIDITDTLKLMILLMT